MHTEAQIKRAIKPLLTVYGELNTTEVKKLLNTVLEFDDEDKQPSTTRNETLIIQRIGNIVSHQTEKTKIYDEGFVLDKNFRPARFLLLNPVTKKVIKPVEIEKIKNKTKKFKARKIDWEKARDRNNEIGDQGEEFAMEWEIDRLTEILPRDIVLQSVQHLSRLQGDGLGYDISSINECGTTRFIEVKTTSGDFNTPFYMSKNEKNFFEEYTDNAYIYRVYSFNKETRYGKIKIISANELFSDFNFDPVTWQVMPK